MIIKIRQPIKDLEPYVRKSRVVMAKRMRESFMFETGRGWETGRRGDWLVHIADEIWAALSDAQFHQVYREVDEKKDCVGPCGDFGPIRREEVPDDR